MYSGIKDPARWILPAVLEEMAQQKPHDIWIETTEGESTSYGAMFADANRMAGYFAGLGIQPGDHVAVWLRSGLDFVRVWLGLGRLGAVAVLLNTELRGSFLAHQLNSCGAKLIVADASLQPALNEVASTLTQPLDLVVVGTQVDINAVAPKLNWSAWRTAEPWDGPLPQPQDIFCVMYTSGTSGPSKGVQMPHAHCVLFGIGAIECLQLKQEDKYYITAVQNSRNSAADLLN